MSLEVEQIVAKKLEIIKQKDELIYKSIISLIMGICAFSNETAVQELPQTLNKIHEQSAYVYSSLIALIDDLYIFMT